MIADGRSIGVRWADIAIVLWLIATVAAVVAEPVTLATLTVTGAHLHAAP